MSKNRRNRSTRSTGGYSGTPLRPTPSRASPALPSFRFRPVPSYYRLTRPPASPSVSHLSTVRPPLMRTVFTDTTSRSRSPRAGVLKQRHSADVLNRVVARAKSWNTFLSDPFTWTFRRAYEATPLHRAVTCARRSIRREVLLALGLGNGSGSRGVPKSKVRCV